VSVGCKWASSSSSQGFFGLALKRKGDSDKKRNLLLIEKEDCNADKIKQSKWDLVINNKIKTLGNRIGDRRGKEKNMKMKNIQTIKIILNSRVKTIIE
jgi:hypothetical protein